MNLMDGSQASLQLFDPNATAKVPGRFEEIPNSTYRGRLSATQAPTGRKTGHWVDSFRKPEPSIIGMMDTQTHRHFGITFGVAVASAVTTFAVSFFAFRWLLICYQEWRIGHRDIFVTWAEMTALPFSLLASAIVLWLVLVAMKRRKQNIS
jgi:hypothetical protein